MAAAVQKKNWKQLLAAPSNAECERRGLLVARRLRRARLARTCFSAVLVTGLHGGLVYALAHAVEPIAPTTSVPLVISLATAAEPTVPKPVVAPPLPKPKPRPKPVKKAPVLAKAPDPLPLPEPPAEVEPPPVQEPPPPMQTAAIEAPAPPQVVPPRFDAAYLNNPVPAYPLLSRRMREEGRVLLRVYVKSDGSAGDIQVSDSSGWPRLDHAAAQAVQHWKFAPARRGDEPVGAWVLVPVNFTLSQG